MTKAVPSLEELARRADERADELRRDEAARQAEYDHGLGDERVIGQALFDEREAARQAERDAVEEQRRE